MPVVPAPVAAVLDDAAPGNGRAVGHGERVHVRAQRDGRARTLALDEGDDAAGNARGVVRDPPLGELLSDDAARAGGVESELGMSVDVPANAYELVGEGKDRVRDALARDIVDHDDGMKKR